jgi:hypothetical protein
LNLKNRIFQIFGSKKQKFFSFCEPKTERFEFLSLKISNKAESFHDELKTANKTERFEFVDQKLQKISIFI